MYGPCNTCIAWLVTEPEELAMGFAVALTPPTSVAYEGKHVAVDNIKALANLKTDWSCL